MTRSSKPRATRRAARKKEDKDGSNGEGNAAGTEKAAAPEAAPAVLPMKSAPAGKPIESKSISKDEQAVLRRMDEKQAELQRRIGAYRMQIRGLENEESALCQQLAQKAQEMQQETVRVAAAHGVDPQDKTKRWSVDVEKGQIHRIQ
jgi:hypothetical protein